LYSDLWVSRDAAGIEYMIAIALKVVSKVIATILHVEKS
jgi:hypothetical protein